MEEKVKLKRVMQFLKQTINDKRIMLADNLSQLCTWYDVAYGVHPDNKSHTGGCMSFGFGLIHCKSIKENLNMKSSTEYEVVGVKKYLPYNIFICLFVVSQGFSIKQNILFQYNQSTIQMENNGNKSCTGNSRHIYI